MFQQNNRFHTLDRTQSRYSSSYICRCEMVCKSRIVQPPGKHVRKSCVKQAPPGKIRTTSCKPNQPGVYPPLNTWIVKWGIICKMFAAMIETTEWTRYPTGGLWPVSNRWCKSTIRSDGSNAGVRSLGTAVVFLIKPKIKPKLRDQEFRRFLFCKLRVILKSRMLRGVRSQV